MPPNTFTRSGIRSCGRLSPARTGAGAMWMKWKFEPREQRRDGCGTSADARAGMAGFAAGRVERDARHVAHVDADRGKGAAGIEPARQPLVGSPVVRERARTHDVRDTERARKLRNELRLYRAQAGYRHRLEPADEHPNVHAKRCRILSRGHAG